MLGVGGAAAADDDDINRCKAGRPNARVLPEPVAAMPTRSRWAAMMGQQCDWMGEGVVNVAVAASRGWGKPAKVSTGDVLGGAFSTVTEVVDVGCWAWDGFVRGRVWFLLVFFFMVVGAASAGVPSAFGFLLVFLVFLMDVLSVVGAASAVVPSPANVVSFFFSFFSFFSFFFSPNRSLSNVVAACVLSSSVRLRFFLSFFVLSFFVLSFFGFLSFFMRVVAAVAVVIVAATWRDVLLCGCEVVGGCVCVVVW